MKVYTERLQWKLTQETNLDVAGILVALVHGHLELLADPDLHLIHVTRELLHRLRLAQFGAVLQKGALQVSPSVGEKLKMFIEM